ncbi:hypothetical protein NDU88_003088 [Pleurodeles waltl]|uniref:Uncharacterized protein n=1 Tax=Pleurodeles waltl TaxID=8319 RepID=A0AAV7WND6_PLEWA|nr:hypothetical protein NDU88_003088 [Pleurodeles waltl]
MLGRRYGELPPPPRRVATLWSEMQGALIPPPALSGRRFHSPGRTCMPRNSPCCSPRQQALQFSALVLPHAGPTSIPGPWAGSRALPTVSAGALLPDLLRCCYLVVLLD